MGVILVRMGFGKVVAVILILFGIVGGYFFFVDNSNEGFFAGSTISAPEGVSTGFSDYSSKKTVKWSASSGEVNGYKMYYGVSEDDLSSVKDVGDVTEYPLYGISLEDGTTYYIAISAYNDAGEGPQSDIIEVYIPYTDSDFTTPLAPRGVFVELDGKNVRLSWDANGEDYLSGYNLYYGIASMEYGIPVPAGLSDEYVFSDLEGGERYYFSITAMDPASEESGFSFPEVSIVVPV